MSSLHTLRTGLTRFTTCSGSLYKTASQPTGFAYKFDIPIQTSHRNVFKICDLNGVVLLA